MRLNPEIQRNLWLEFSWHRAIAMPAVILLILFAVAYNADDTEVVRKVCLTACGLFYLIVYVWGGYKAASSVVEEVNDNTWDFQRLSALSPWSLTLGKLFGAPSYAWYGGIPLFLIICLTLPYNGGSFLGQGAFFAIVSILTAALTVHAIAILSSLISIQGNTKAHRKYRAFRYLAIGLFFGGNFGGMLGNSLTGGRIAAAMPKEIAWYGYHFDLWGFQSVTAISLLAWCIAGIYWQMRYQMGEKNSPVLWVGFIIFWLVHMGGGATPVGMPSKFTDFFAATSLATPFLFSIGCLYAIAFWETWGLVRYRRISALMAAKNYKEAWIACPRWLATLPLCLVAMAWLWGGRSLDVDTQPMLILMAMVLLFAIRDISILHFFKLSPNSRRAKQATFFYMFVLYALLPFLFHALHWDAGRQFLLPPLGNIDPHIKHAVLVSPSSLVAPFVQALIGILLAVWKWQKNKNLLA